MKTVGGVKFFVWLSSLRPINNLDYPATGAIQGRSFQAEGEHMCCKLFL